jgi:hypothetical protein
VIEEFERTAHQLSRSRGTPQPDEERDAKLDREFHIGLRRVALMYAQLVKVRYSLKD